MQLDFVQRIIKIVQTKKLYDLIENDGEQIIFNRFRKQKKFLESNRLASACTIIKSKLINSQGELKRDFISPEFGNTSIRHACAVLLIATLLKIYVQIRTNRNFHHTEYNFGVFVLVPCLST